MCALMCLTLHMQVSHNLPNVRITGHGKVHLNPVLRTEFYIPVPLRDTLTSLAPLQGPDVELILHGFVMGEPLAADIAAAASPVAGWGRLSLTDSKWPADAAVTTPLPPLQTVCLPRQITDGTQAQLVRCAPVVRERLCVRAGPGLPTAPPAGLQLPWTLVCQMILLHSNGFADWLQRAREVSYDVIWEIEVFRIQLTTEQVRQLPNAIASCCKDQHTRIEVARVTLKHMQLSFTRVVFTQAVVCVCVCVCARAGRCRRAPPYRTAAEQRQRKGTSFLCEQR